MGDNQRNNVSLQPLTIESALILPAVTDLTFHGMDFLRQPRREAQKPLSRKREADKKRSDREREDVSAFFLQGNVPIALDAPRNRSKPAAAVLSSADSLNGDTSSRASGRWRSSSQSAIVAQSGLLASTGQEQERNEHLQGDKATTYLSWTTSHASSRPGVQLASQSPGKQISIHSPTPTDVREALAETGVFHNTGIPYMGPITGDHETWSRDEVAMPRRFGGSPRILASQTYQNEPIQIVRYQDRGTMVTQEDIPRKRPDEHIGNIHVRPHAINPLKERLQGASKTSLGAPTQTNAALASGVPTQLVRRTTDAHVSPSPKQAPSNHFTIDGQDKEHGTRTGRPVSPKLSVVERLEAAANSHWREPTERETIHDARHGEWYPGPQGDGRESMPLSREGARWWPAHTARLGMVRNRETPVTVSSCFVSTEFPELLVRDTSAHEETGEADGFVQYCEHPDHQAVDISPSMMFDQNTKQAGQGGHGMREYITQLEREVLASMHGDVSWGPTLEERDNRALTRHQSQTEIGTQPPSRMSPTLLQQSSKAASHPSWVQAWNHEDTEEQERRFMSSFWRPN